jgi:hypothetical protein
MSRRVTLSVLAAATALIATSASADPECFGESCRMPEIVEPPAGAFQPPQMNEPAAAEASAAAAKVGTGPALPQVAAEPVARPPVPAVPSLADQASQPPLAPRPVKALPRPMRVEVVAAAGPSPEPEAPVSYIRAGRVASPDTGYIVGANATAAGAVVVVVPGAAYGHGRYLLAPGAKIISIDRDD